MIEPSRLSPSPGASSARAVRDLLDHPIESSVSRQSITRWEARGRTILARRRSVPKVMGIVNLTPDSFSDGGRLVELRRSGRLRAAAGRARGPTCSTSAASRAARGQSRSRSTKSCAG